jgi:hypothetical protein
VYTQTSTIDLLTLTDLVEIADPRNGHDPFLMATADLKEAMKEALTMAQSAFDVMKDHTADQHVSDMLRLILGDDATYQSKFDAVKRKCSSYPLVALNVTDRSLEQKPFRTSWASTRNLLQTGRSTKAGRAL